MFLDPYRQYYRTFIENEDVHTFRTKRIQCPSCYLDISLEKLRPPHHKCNYKSQKVYKYTSQENNGLSLLRSFKNKKVILTFSRLSGFQLNLSGYDNLRKNHNHRYSLGLNFLNLLPNNSNVVQTTILQNWLS